MRPSHTEAGLSYREIGRRTGTHESQIDAIRHGRIVERYDVLVRIADGLTIPRHARRPFDVRVPCLPTYSDASALAEPGSGIRQASPEVKPWSVMPRAWLNRARWFSTAIA